MPENEVDTEELDLSLDRLPLTSFEHLDPAMPEASVAFFFFLWLCQVLVGAQMIFIVT